MKLSLKKKLVLGITILSTITYGTSFFFISFLKDFFLKFMSEGIFIAGTLSLGILWSALFGWVAANIITTPLVKLSRVAEEVSKGNLKAEIDIPKSEDELKILSLSFQFMLKNLRDLISQVATTSHQVASSSAQLTASVSQTTEASEQIVESIQGVADGADKQEQMAEESVKEMEKMMNVVKSGNQSVQKTVEQMKIMNESVGEASHLVIELGERSKEIGQILEVITDISEQTNLLALNAAIEAARAGEAGKGFAVVADEVRKLAEQSEKSAKQISNLVQNIQRDTKKSITAMERGSKEVEQGFLTVKETEHSFQEILEASEKVIGKVKEVSSIAGDSSNSTKHIAGASEEQLATMEEISSASQALSYLADELQNIVEKFRI